MPLLAYRRGVENLAGAAVLAIAAFWAVYLLPQRVSERSQVVEARTEDRHSGAMRILAVARREGREEPGASRDCPPGQVPHGRLLTGPMPVVVAQPVVAAEGVVTMDRPVIASQRHPGAPAGRANAPAAPSTGTTPSGSARTADPARTSGAERARARALAERRAAAARRRLALTLTLLAASAIAWTSVSAFSLHVAVPTALTVALGGVLALGRRAVVAARRSDAQAAARASRPAAARTPRPAARPASSTAPRRGEAARTASVTGRAVRASQTATQMISSVEVLERATAAAERSSTTRGSADAVAAVDEASETPVDVVSMTTAVEAPVVAETVVRTVVERPAAEADDDRVLGGFSLPRPTYTMKAAAPRREVAPLADADVTTPANAAERAGAAGTSGVTAGSSEEPGTTTEGLGLGLDAILARRRASGA